MPLAFLTYISVGAILDFFMELAKFFFQRYIKDSLKGKSMWKVLTCAVCFYALYTLVWPAAFIWYLACKIEDNEADRYE